MKSQDKKLVILQQLSQQTPISLPNLLQKLPENYPERSVRRWLNQLIQEGLVEKSGHKRGTQYLAKDNRESLPSRFNLESAVIIEQVRLPIYERMPTTYHHEWLAAYEPNKSFYFSKQLKERLHKAGERASDQDPAGTYAHQIFNRLLIDLSYNSSRLEGNTYSLLDTERLILKGIDAEGKLDDEKTMIINHKEAICYLVDHVSKSQVNLETICTLHYLLSDGLLEAKYSGKVRDHSVRIGGSTYLPLANQKQLQLYLSQIVQKAISIKDPFEQSIFFLIHLSYLQPFLDVNKRTARLAANIPLITRNLVPLSFNDVERTDYNSAMIAVYELQEVGPLVDLYTYSYLRTCVAYDSTVKALGFDQVRVRYRGQRREMIRKIIERELIGAQITRFIEAETKKKIPEEDRSLFVEDLMEDLEQIDHSRIVGLGITAEQLNIWLKLSSQTPRP